VNERINTPKVNGLPGGESQRGQSHAVEAESVRRCVWRAALRDLRDMAKAILLEPQYPAMKRSSLDYRIYITRPSVYQLVEVDDTGNLSTDGRWVTNHLRGRTGCLSRVSFLCVNVGLPTESVHA
jgi:hypothetical protein